MVIKINEYLTETHYSWGKDCLIQKTRENPRKLGILMYKKCRNALTLSDVCERTNLVTRLQCQLAESTSVKGSIVIQYSVHLALNNLTNNDLEY